MEAISEGVATEGRLLATKSRGKALERVCGICEIRNVVREAYCPICTAKIREVKTHLAQMKRPYTEGNIAQSIRRHWRVADAPQMVSIRIYARVWNTAIETIIQLCAQEGLATRGTREKKKEPHYLPVATVIFLDMLLEAGITVQTKVRPRCTLCHHPAAGNLPLCIRHLAVWEWMCEKIGKPTYMLPLIKLGQGEAISLGSLALLTGGAPHEVLEDAKEGYLEIDDPKAPIPARSAWLLLRRFIAGAEEKYNTRTK